MMNFGNTDIEKLLPAYFAGELPEAERAMVDHWKNQSPENQAICSESLKAWEAMPLLREMEQFNSFDALKKINARLSEPAPSARWWEYLQKAAAILILPLLIYSVYVSTQKTGFLFPTDGTPVVQTISSHQGMVSHFELADGTKVWLNSGSELQFPSSFKGAIREVKLKGEAFFEVTKNPDQPFRVNARELKIDVLGTSFNVASYEDETQTEVILAEGKVSLSDEKNQLRKEYGSISPGQRAVYSQNERKVYAQEVEVDKYISWREGNLIFRDDNMEEVVKRMSRWFNVQIVFNDPEIKAYSYKATFRNETLTQVLDLLKISAPIDYRITGNKALPNGEFTKLKVFLMKKKS